jgi:serine/threonine-protein kinase
MGTVYEAVDSRDGGRVAVKLLHPWLAAEDSSFRDRFEREAHIAALLRSPYSVRLLDFGVADGTYFLVMEYVAGTTVGKELEQGAMEPVRALRIAIDVARALEEAAARGVIHRDIKPDNILLTTDGRVKVTDFGIARQEGGTGLTSAGRFVGTAEYAAPEQAVGEADHRADIYSLGVTLYCMLTGHLPFQGATVWELLREHQTTPVSMEPLSHLPDSIGNPIRRCMEKDPRDRYQTASELAGALERALASLLHSTQAPRASHAPGPSGEAATPPPPAAMPATRVAEPPQSRQPDAAATRVAGGTPAPAAPGHVPIGMVVAPVGQAVDGVSHFELTISNPQLTPMRLSLSVVDVTGLLNVAVASPVTLAGNEVQRLPVEVRQMRPAPERARTLQFQITAQYEDGSRAGFVNVTVIPAAGARGGGTRLWLLVAVGGAALAAAGAVFVMLQGGEKATPPATATPAVTAPASPATTVTAAKSINVLARWDYAFKITSNSCPFGASVGDRYTVSFRFDPATGASDVIRDGDRVTVTAIQDREIPIGTFTFRFVDFEFTYPVAARDGQRGAATLRTTFADASTIASSSLSERYDSPSCTIAGAPAN